MKKLIAIAFVVSALAATPAYAFKISDSSYYSGGKGKIIVYVTVFTF